MTVSVVIPFYNNIEWLEESLESVLAQTLPANEILVVDDGSPEDTSLLQEKYGNVVTWVRKTNGGPASARNVGIEIATSEYIAFLDADDIWLPRKLEAQHDLMNASGMAWSHASYSTFMDEQAGRIRLQSVNAAHLSGMIYPRLLSSNRLATPCIMIRREILVDAPALRFPEDWRFGQDQVLWMEMALRYPIGAVEEELALVRIRGSNASLRARVQIESRANMWRRLKGSQGRPRLPLLLRAGFVLSSAGSAVVSSLTRLGADERRMEAVARGMYVLPWLLFKCQAVLSSR